MTRPESHSPLGIVGQNRTGENQFNSSSPTFIRTSVLCFQSGLSLLNTQKYRLSERKDYECHASLLKTYL